MIKLFFLLVVLFTGTLKAQETASSFHIKKGLYVTFKDIRNNQPFPDTNIIIKERTGLRGGGGDYKIDTDSLTRNTLNDLKKKMVGYSDGQQFYISDRFTTGGERGLTKCILNGPYIIANVEVDGPSSSGIGMSSGVHSYVINFNKGLSLKLSKDVIKDILSKYPDLNEEYKSKKHPLDFTEEILRRVNEKEPIMNDAKIKE